MLKLVLRQARHQTFRPNAFSRAENKRLFPPREVTFALSATKHQPFPILETPRRLKKKMSYNFREQINNIVRTRSLLTAALALASAFGGVSPAVAQRVTPPPTPSLITPEAGNSAFLFGHGVGTQGYICLPTAPGASTAAWN